MSQLTIQEQTQKTTATSQSGASFTWDATHFNAPKGPWSYGVKLRTVRTDYPGAEQPTEQVLGSNFKPFSMDGVWLDRYNGGSDSDYAVNTMESFQAMVRRGNLVVFTFESLTFTGLITDLDIKYFTRNKIGYSFTVSPHYSNATGDVRKTNLAPKPSAGPADHDQAVQDLIAQAQQKLATIPSYASVAGVYTNIVGLVNTLQDRADTVSGVVAGRVFTIAQSVDPTNRNNTSLARLVQALESTRNAARDLLAGTTTYASRSTGTGSTLAYEDPVAIMNMEDGVRSLRVLARQLIVRSQQAANDMTNVIAPDAQALYQTQAGESLYSISQRFYGTPHRWTEIAYRNGLNYFVLTGQELLVIPLNGTGA